MDKIEKFDVEFSEKDWSYIESFFDSKKSISIPNITKQIYFYNDDTYLTIELKSQKIIDEKHMLAMYISLITNNTIVDSNLYVINDYCELFSIYNSKQIIDDCYFDIYLNIIRVFKGSIYETITHKKECLDKNTNILSSKNLYTEQLRNLLVYIDLKNNNDLINFCYFFMLRPNYLIEEDICEKILLKMNYYCYCDNFDKNDLTTRSFYNVINNLFLDTEEVIIEKATKYVELICKCSKYNITPILMSILSLSNSKLKDFRDSIYENYYNLIE